MQLSHRSKTRKWTRTEKWTAGGVIAALVIGASSFFVPDVRRVLGLEKPDPIEAKTLQTQTAAIPPVPINNRIPTPKVIIKQHVTGNGAVGGSITAGPCSNIQIGGNNNQAIGGNCVPKISPPKISWSIVDRPTIREAKQRPEVWVRISIDRNFPDAKFAVTCARPCKPADGLFTTIGRGGMFGASWNSIQTNVAGFFIDYPNPMPLLVEFDACVESDDDKPIDVMNVTAILVDPKL